MPLESEDIQPIKHYHLRYNNDVSGVHNDLVIPEIVSTDLNFVKREMAFRKFVVQTITGYEVEGENAWYFVLFKDYSTLQIFECTNLDCEVVK